MSKRKKLNAKMPPLSALDKFIYAILLIIYGCIPTIAILVFGLYIPNEIAFSDPSVVARDIDAAILCALPVALTIMFSLIIPIEYGWSIKQPIFGNKKFVPSFSKPTIKVYPIFSKEFRESISPNRKRRAKKTTIIYLTILLIAALIIPFGLFPRTVLNNDNSITTYNSFNKVTRTCNIEDSEKLVIGAYRSRSSWKIELSFVFEDKTYRFGTGSFHEMDTESALKHMLLLKEYFKDGKYEIKNADKVDNLVYSKFYTDEEIALVYNLFDYDE